MRPASREQITTVERAVADAAQACDPEQASDGVTALVRSFEGDERPATAAEDLGGELRSAARAIDPDGVDPVVAVSAATAHWLATNPSGGGDPDRAVREGSRLFFADAEPEPVRQWLRARGVE